jgi:hypothetical protein
MPPVAPKVREQLESEGRYTYIEEVRSILRDLGIPFADFHDAASIPATDCEFTDGYHAGDIAYLKMLVKMARSWSWLTPLVDLPKAERTISAFDGNIIDQSASEKFKGISESSYLGLECARRQSSIATGR